MIYIIYINHTLTVFKIIHPKVPQIIFSSSSLLNQRIHRDNLKEVASILEIII